MTGIPNEDREPMRGWRPTSADGEPQATTESHQRSNR